MIDVRRDYAGLRIAAAELYIESFLSKEIDLLICGATPEAALETVTKILPGRSVSVGFYHWTLYLLWLRSVAGIPGASIAYLADEAEGLVVVGDVEREFRRAHPNCYKCGALNERDAGMCRECSAEFKD